MQNFQIGDIVTQIHENKAIDLLNKWEGKIVSVNKRDYGMVAEISLTRRYHALNMIYEIGYKFSCTLGDYIELVRKTNRVSHFPKWF